MGRSDIGSNVTAPDRFVLGILGMPGSGKSQVAQFLNNCGFPVIRLGGFVEDEVMRRGMSPGPSSEALIRNSLREEFGKDVLARRVLEALSQNPSTLLFVLDGVYSPEEDALFRRELSSSYFTIAILCDRLVRYGRLENRDHRHLNNEEAAKRDLQEMQSLRKADSIVMADHFVLNNDDLQTLLRATFEKIVGNVADALDTESNSWLEGSPHDLASRIEVGHRIPERGLWLLIARAQLANDPILSWHVCRLIGDSAYEQGLQYLLFIGQADDVEFDQSSLHRIAGWSLGKVGCSHTILLPLLEAESWQTRRFAADSLGEIGDPQVLDALLNSFAGEPHEGVIKWIGLSITKLSKGSWRELTVNRLTQLISESSGKKRLWAIDSLARIDKTSAQRFLKDLDSGEQSGDVKIQNLQSEIISRHLKDQQRV